MIKQSILTFIILFFTFTTLAIATEVSIEPKTRSIDTIAPVRKVINARKLGVFRRATPKMALPPLDFLTKQELQEMELLQVVLEFRQALASEKSQNKNKVPIHVLYSHIEGAFIKSRSKQTHAMDMFFFELWEHFQGFQRHNMNGDLGIEAFKQSYRDIIPVRLPETQREELAAVINSIDTFS
jgi:hypothetical protein